MTSNAAVMRPSSVQPPVRITAMRIQEKRTTGLFSAVWVSFFDMVASERQPQRFDARVQHVSKLCVDTPISTTGISSPEHGHDPAHHAGSGNHHDLCAAETSRPLKCHRDQTMAAQCDANHPCKALRASNMPFVGSGTHRR